MASLVINRGWQPGLIGTVTALHSRFYAEHWDFGAYFEAKVARDMANYFDRYDPETDLTLVASVDNGSETEGTIVGSITIDAGEPESVLNGVHLRWFITDDTTRGQGLGRTLMDQAMEHVQTCGFEKVYLTSFAGLEPARHLYESYGFVLEDETEDDTWGRAVSEQLFVWEEN